MALYAEHTIGSKNPLKRWLHKQRFAASFRLLGISDGQRFLDYGCGDGELSLQISKRFPLVDIAAYDPAEELYAQAQKKLAHCPRILVTNRLDSVTGTFDKIACLETIEHLPPQELETLFLNIKKFLKEDGVCLFTFPVEHGAASLVKNIYRMRTKRDKYASLGRMIWSALGLPVAREPQEKLSGCNYIYSHIGFDCRMMVQSIEKHFTIVRVKVLPVGTLLFGLGNSLAVLAKGRQ